MKHTALISTHLLVEKNGIKSSSSHHLNDYKAAFTAHLSRIECLISIWIILSAALVVPPANTLPVATIHLKVPTSFISISFYAYPSSCSYHLHPFYLNMPRGQSLAVTWLRDFIAHCESQYNVTGAAFQEAYLQLCDHEIHLDEIVGPFAWTEPRTGPNRYCSPLDWPHFRDTAAAAVILLSAVYLAVGSFSSVL
jgi:hypothetical protein